MKNKVNVGDKVVCLYGTTLAMGECIKINKKSIKVHMPAQKCYQEVTKNFVPEKIANINDQFTIVWEADVGVEGRYRIDYDTYPNQNKTYKHWLCTTSYIVE